MHIFKDPSDTKSYETKVKQCADNLLDAFAGGDYTVAIAVLDWMKDAVAVNSCVAGLDRPEAVTSRAPSFPFKTFQIKGTE